jgi:hypothetical protein
MNQRVLQGVWRLPEVSIVPDYTTGHLEMPPLPAKTRPAFA